MNQNWFVIILTDLVNLLINILYDDMITVKSSIADELLQVTANNT